MTAPAECLGRFGRPLSWVRWGTAVSAAAVVALLSLPGTSQAQGPGYDPVSGIGSTASAVTVPWTSGLRDANNNPITSAGTELSPNSDRSGSNPTGQLSFMYNDFKKLQVTVSQTQDLTHQGISVSWTGGEPPTAFFGSNPGTNFLQMMECYGDAATGPTPEQCEYGSVGMLPNGVGPFISQRIGFLCDDPNAVPDPSKPPMSHGILPCDTKGTSDPAANAPKCPPSTCSGGLFDIPFVPVSDPSNPDYQQGDTTYYSPYNTDEVQQAVTGTDGTGQVQFQALTGIQAPGLGCGLPDADNNNKARGCWLVIVPRGQYEPNGTKIPPNSANAGLDTSPLSPSNWAQRIQIHLSFASAPQFCPIGTPERQAGGTQLVTRAMVSWEFPLNQGTNCTRVFSYTAVPEATATSELSDPTSGVGLAMTTIPIGSEATRSGGSPPSNLPPILYAPVAVSALGFGFNINETQVLAGQTSGYYAKPVKLTPMLMAKALTQSYQLDLPQYNNAVEGGGVPAWAKSNPGDISSDPEFTKINPGVASRGSTLAPQLTEEHSALTQQVWQWIQGDSAASGWLGGAPDKNDNNMVVNPVYQALNLGNVPIDNYPRADNGGSTPSQCVDLGTDTVNKKEMTICALDIIPYANNYDSAAANVLAGKVLGISSRWNPSLQAPDGTDGYWDPSPPEPLGGIWLWAATDTSDLAAYGLIPAQLCDDSGSTCVGPTSASLTAALNAAKPDSSGLLHVDPAHPGNGGYPLTVVTYAAVSTKQSAAALTDYANLIAYAAGKGQTVGSAPGDLPPGYLPMPSSLRAQAQNVVAKLRKLANPSRSRSSPATRATSGTTPGGTSTQPATTGSTPTRGATAAPTAGTTPSEGPVTSLPPAQPAADTTPRQAVGALRWALVGVAIAGGGAAGGGTLLRAGGIPLWLRRRRPG
jgi:hypothetical protein